MGDHSELEEVQVDALYRAWRTFLQGLAVVVLTAGATALTAALAPGIQWTAGYWQAAGLAVAQAVVVAVASYVHRRFGAEPSV